MASEYLKWKYRDVKPDPPRVLTPKERRANWWHYHKWYLVTGLIFILAMANIIYRISGIGQVCPDCQFACVHSVFLPEDTVSALESALAVLMTDRDGDGTVSVRLNQYMIHTPDTADTDAAMYAYASGIRLIADLENCDSYFFLLEDPEEFQRNYEILSGDVFLWGNCPVLVSLPLGQYQETPLGQSAGGDSQALLAGLYLARRVPPDNMDTSAWDHLWEILTEGAVS